jgi:carbon-monoxide dehydrogenase small subunit
MVMSIVDLCRREPDADEARIREALDGNYCRCTGYQNIVRAVQQAQQTLRS